VASKSKARQRSTTKGTIKCRRRFALEAFLAVAMLEIAAVVTGGSQANARWRSSFIDESHPRPLLPAFEGHACLIGCQNEGSIASGSTPAKSPAIASLA
jgi:hypothetical protein